MAIPEDTIRQVRESVDVVEVVSEYVSLKKRGGKNYFGLCPFHQEKTPSFSVNSELQIFRCFGCGKSGNVITFLMEIERIDFIDAVRRLGERCGIPIDEKSGQTGQNEALYKANELAFKYFRHRLTKMDGEDIKFARKYLRDRGITEEIEAKFEIGLSPPGWDSLIQLASKRGINADVLERAGLAIRKEAGGWYDRFRGRLMFPIRNAGSKVVAFGGRILHEDPQHPAPKYLNSPETGIYHKGKLVYGLAQARDAMRMENTAILVEGYTDLIALHRVGLGHAVASLGTALTSDQALLIKRFANRVIMLYDADAAGISAASRGADILVGADLDVRIALMPEGEDPDTLIQAGGRESMDIVLENAEPLIDFKIGYFRKQGQFSTPQGQTEATRAIIDTLRRVPDRITRQYAIHEAAEKLRIDERVLTREMAKIQTPDQGKQDTSPQINNRAANRFERMIQDLVWALVRHPEHRSVVFNKIGSVDLGNHPLRIVMEKIENAYDLGEPVTEADLYDTLLDRPDVLHHLEQIFKRPEPKDTVFEEILDNAYLMKQGRELKEEKERYQELVKVNSDSETVRKYYESRIAYKKWEDRFREKFTDS